MARFCADSADDGTEPMPTIRTARTARGDDALHFPLLFSGNGLDPIAELGERRVTEPVSKLELLFGITTWLVTGYDAAKEVLGDSTSFGNLTSAGSDDGQDPGGLGMTDPPYHTRLRKMLTPEFTMRRLQRLKPRTVAIVDQQLDAIERAGQPADLVDLFAMSIPSLGFCELLGVPYEDRDGFQALSTARCPASRPPRPLPRPRPGPAHGRLPAPGAARQDRAGLLASGR